MLDDVYVEQLFTAKTPSKLLISFLGLVLILLMGTLLVLIKAPFILLVYAFLSICLILYCKDALYVEYEYALVNNELTVAVIYNKKRRAVIYETDLMNLLSADVLPNEAAYLKAKKQADFDLSPNFFTDKLNLCYLCLELNQGKKGSCSIIQRKSHMQTVANQHKIIIALDDRLANKMLRFIRRVNPNIQIQ